MPLVYNGVPLEGGNDDDFIIDDPRFDGADSEISGFGGDDLIYGDSTVYFDLAFDAAGAESITALTGLWSKNENPDIFSATTIPHVTLYGGAAPGTTNWVRVDVVAGQTITLDIDYGSDVIGNVSVDTMLRIFRSDATTLVPGALNDDGPIASGGSGSTSGLDSFLQHTFATSGTYYIEIARYSGFSPFVGGEEFLLNISLTGQNSTGAISGGKDAIIGGDGNDVLYGMGGDDEIFGGNDNDRLHGGNGKDLLDGGAGNDTLEGVDGDDTLIAGTGIDNLFGGKGADIILMDSDEDAVAGEIRDGGDNEDLLFIFKTKNDAVDLRTYSISNIETLFLGDTGSGVVGSTTLNMDQFKFKQAVLDAHTTPVQLVVNSTGQTTFDLSKVTFSGFGASDSVKITGTIDADTITGGSANDIIDTGAGADQLDGGGGGDTMIGGAGSDTYFLNSSSDIVDESVAGSDGDDTVRTSNLAINLNFTSKFKGSIENVILGSTFGLSLTGNGLDNKLTGNIAANLIEGGGGKDTINGGGGADTLRGGADDDTYIVDAVGSKVEENVNAGTDRVNTTLASYTLAANVEFLDFVGNPTADFKGTGSAQDNTIQALGGNDTLDGKAGKDLMRGFGGNDTYYVDNAGDVIDGEIVGNGTETVIASADYTLAAGQEIEFLQTILGTNTTPLKLTGNEFAQTITGNSGANALDGKGGADTMFGGAGSDNYFIDSSGDVVDESISGSNGSDTVRSSNLSINLGFASVFKGNIENAVLSGFGNLNLTGNALGNYLQGNNGANIINGGGGNDTLVGLGGNDTFRFANSIGSTNIDKISDYNVAQDKIELENSYFSALTTTGVLSAAAFVANTTGLATDASDRIIYETDTGKLFYDSNGTTAGGTYQQIATLSAGLVMTAGEFFVT